jgi:hypothetical protein
VLQEEGSKSFTNSLNFLYIFIVKGEPAKLSNLSEVEFALPYTLGKEVKSD